MIERTVVSQAIAQAKDASLQLRGLLKGDMPEPDPQTIQALLEAGAQSLWMSARASVQSDHAIVLAAQCGFASTVEVLGKFEGALPLAKGKSIFEAALGSVGKSFNSLPQFKATVNALLGVGYKMEDENSLKLTALESALSWGMRGHAKVLIEAGALLPNLAFRHEYSILPLAMKIEGAAQDLLDYAPKDLRDRFIKGWWHAISRARPRMSKELEDAVILGQTYTPMTHEDYEGLSSTVPCAVVLAFKHGYKPPPMLALQKYDLESPMEPFWSLHSDWVKMVVEANAPLDSLNLGQHEIATGRDWFMHMLLEKEILSFKDYKPPPVKEISFLLKELKKQGFWDPGHLDNDGKTAGWYIAKIQGETGRNMSAYKNACWSLIEEFDLFQYPVLTSQGELVPLWEDASMPVKYLENPSDPLWFRAQETQYASGKLSQATQLAQRTTQARRM